jgi:hypothetical protein
MELLAVQVVAVVQDKVQVLRVVELVGMEIPLQFLLHKATMAVLVHFMQRQE